ncbi:MAG: L-seryl-tRNA(Sec) selenium transferase [Akkermansiaceae bacterium]|nr:L-seryl-tRNA(Sec) selenium transferase [Akkermansiaceae bacterium]
MPDFSQLPSVEKLTAALEAGCPLPRPLITGFIQHELAAWRERLTDGREAGREEITASIRAGLLGFAASRLQPVVNATGVLIHTNLGRSPMGARGAEALQAIATGYSNLEFDLPGGQRGKRAAYLETALAVLLESEAATAVNNCAAALVLTLRHLIAGGKTEVIVSRGELVEIGGGFRIPDVLETSGATLREVGATNKTHLKDYAEAISDRTALILKVHRSNFTLSGFTSEPPVPELATLAREHQLPLVEDLGSGAVMATDDLAPIDHEPTPQEALRNGIDLVVFSGDKLLGGPQAGIIAGKRDLVAGIKAEPFYRAVRCDKLILTTLQECIDDYLQARGGDPPELPVLTFMATPVDDLRARAAAIIENLPGHSAALTVVEATSRTGGGTMPHAEIPSIAIAIDPRDRSLDDLAAALRTGSPAVVGYTQDDRLLLNLRTVFPHQDEALTSALQAALGA